MSRRQLLIKRIFDFTLALVGLILTFPIILIAWVIATLETKTNGFFIQTRIGKGGKPFKIIKIRTMYPIEGTTITTANDRRITKSGRIFRKYKIDELPQLINILKGEMSFVGPRPDVPGYADKLTGEDRIILEVPPGITGPATLKYRNEEEILAQVENPQWYNDNVIWKDKVKINKEYVRNWSLKKDLYYIWKT
ncbi:MAG: sugar transferase, partial [Epsilonproteobacteria bacterium]|nr:sugar transferase [Campylobacterota bacterium]NPA89598.1 sugar transferase [Campylobacterota bacterium]